MTDRQQPLIAIDVVPIGYDAASMTVQYGTAERLFAPFAGEQALPGVLLGADELLTEAAHRALRDKAGVPAGDVRHLTQIGAFDGPGRDPRDKAVSIAFIAIVTSHDTFELGWHEWAETPSLPFDHGTIVAAAKDVARTRLWTDPAFTQALTGDTFLTADAAAITSQVTGHTPAPANFHRTLTRNPALTSEQRTQGGAHGRSMTQWAWAGALRP
ncbi:NUDIX hydrolase [Curtobacterium sp. MCBD17_040]|uniref:NUDIX hydrolase n=1 Tax=Curtobacterium sp. MCBD17_040 TaxID=2175674 RepID=UPI000DAA9C89|nr:NUDIX hydrolase [Curtobacterium sp. MCBD17_040]WIB65393.1 NUDIX hydrolase [Curtobacterium sp. MCBD17_040]